MKNRWSTIVALTVLWIVAGGGWGWGANGDIEFSTPHCGTSPLSAAADLCYDSSDDSLWVLDRGSGEVCHYATSAFPPEILLLGTIPHPFGAATPPFFTPLCSGIAVNSAGGSLYVLNSTTLELHEFDTAGTPIGVPIPLSPPLPSTGVSGLTYDSVSNTLWYRDTVHNLAVECDPATGATLSSVQLPGDSVMYGDGLSFIEVLGGRFLEFTFGNVIDFAPARVIRIDLTGATVCIEVLLGQVPDQVLGIARPPVGTVIYATTATDVYKIDSSNPLLNPPTELTCFSNIDGSIDLNWNNCGPGPGGAYTVLRVLRNGVLLQVMAGNTTSFTDLSPAPMGSVIEYTVEASVGAGSGTTSCAIQTGSGALISYTPFDGGRVFDLALDPNAGELYATDNFSETIYVYDAALTLLRTVTTSGLGNLQGVAYNPILDILLVSASNSSLLTLVDPLTGSSTTQIPAGSQNIPSITYDPISDDYLYVDAASNPVQVIRIEAEQSQQGSFIGACSPPIPTGLALSPGISYLDSDTFLSTVRQSGNGPQSAIGEFSPVCFPTGFSMGLDAIGGSLQLNTAITGIEDLGTTLFLAGGPTNTIFRLLITPGGDLFVRGDCNQDTLIDIADVLFVADYLFVGGSQPSCFDACDSNDDGVLDISDPLYLLFHMFVAGSPPPPLPFPAPGSDPTFLDPLDCF
ncbi:MAG: hypothetical protein ACE5GW_04055 [Planctomycetota bacterium]